MYKSINKTYLSNLNIYKSTVLLLLILISNTSFSQNIFTLSDSNTNIIINKIVIAGNKKTKDKIIKRELMFHKNDTLTEKQLNKLIIKSKDNLTNTSLFNYITINTINDDSTHINIYILLEERWYLFPYLILEQADRNLSAYFHNKQWNRINYGLMLVKYNFRGMGETVKLKFRFGYKQQFQIAYEIPYLGNSHKHGLYLEYNRFRQHEIHYMTAFDKQVFYRDDNSYVYKSHRAKIIYRFRNKYFIRNNFILQYDYANVNDTIIELNTNYFGNNTTSNILQYFTLGYSFKLDKRNYKYYPLTGYNVELSVFQKGLNILPDGMQGITELQSEAYYYKNFVNRWYGGMGGKGKVSSSFKQPYYVERALGYKTYLRAYEYYVINGQSYISGRAFLKYAIIPMQIHHIDFWGWEKFNKIHYSLFVNTFVDAGYVYDVMPNPSNKLPNSFLASAGVGVDLVAYYDMIFRLEYSVNRQKESGFFIHLNKAF